MTENNKPLQPMTDEQLAAVKAEIAAAQAANQQLAIISDDNGRTLLVNPKDPAYLLAQFEAGNTGAFFSSIQNPTGDRNVAIKMYNAISDTLPLREYVNTPLAITDIMAHPVDLLDEKTGEVVPAIRTILIDQDGTAYAAVSEGIRSSITRLVQVAGQLPWSPPLHMIAVQKPTRNAMYQVLTIRLLTPEEVTTGKVNKKK